MNTVLDLIDTSCSLKKKKRLLPIVQGVSFSLFPGRTLAIVGESGSGKSTTALMIMQLLQPASNFQIDGTIRFQNENLLDISSKKLRSIRGGKIAMIFQDPGSALNPVFTIGDQVAEMAEIHLKCTPEEGEAKAIEMLRSVDIPHAARAFETYPHELSGGMKQRVMIAMALIANPEILIADEPTTALDLTIQKEILDLLKKLQKERHMALLLITHDMGVVSYMADDVAVMYAGEIVEFGPVQELFQKPLHPYTQALFQSRPSHATRKKRLEVIQGIAPAAGQRPSGCPFHPRCPFAMEKCREGVVETFYDGERHWAKCWLLETTGKKQK